MGGGGEGKGREVYQWLPPPTGKKVVRTEKADASLLKNSSPI